jgi:hypothetical protein
MIFYVPVLLNERRGVEGVLGISKQIQATTEKRVEKGRRDTGGMVGEKGKGTLKEGEMVE